jgi:hypothetical protein
LRITEGEDPSGRLGVLRGGSVITQEPVQESDRTAGWEGRIPGERR